MLLLGLDEIEEGILEISTCLPLSAFFSLIIFGALELFLLNWDEKYCQNILCFLLTFRLFHLDS